MQQSKVYNYDPKLVVAIVGARHISGYTKDSFISVKRDEDAFSKETGADGITSRAKSNNKAGTLTISLHQTSDSNDYLSSLMLLDEASNGGIVPITLNDMSGRSTVFAAYGWVKKSPDMGYGSKIGNRDWVFDLASIDIFHGGNLS